MVRVSRPPIQTPLLEQAGQRVQRPWIKFFQETHEQINRVPGFIEDTSENLKNYPSEGYPSGTEYFATDTGKFYVATVAKGWVQR